MGLINEVMYAMSQRNKYYLVEYILRDLPFEDNSGILDYHYIPDIIDAYEEYLANK